MVENVAPLQLDEEPFSSDGEAELAAEDMVGLDDWSAMLNNARLDDVLEVESFSGILDEDEEDEDAAPDTLDAVPPTEQEKLKEAWASIRRKLNRGEPYATNAAGVRKRSDASYHVKEWAIQQVAAGTTFHDIQEGVYVRSRGKLVLHGRTQLKKEWPKQVEKCKAARRMGNRKRAPGGGRSAKQVEVDSLLWVYFSARRDDGLAVTNRDLVAEANRLGGRVGFQPTSKWLQSWKTRHNLVPRAAQRKVSHTMDEIRQRLQKFHEFIFLSRLRRKYVAILNFDEIPWSVAGKMSGGGTLEIRGTKVVMIRRDVNHEKRCGSFLCAVLVQLCDDGRYQVVPLRCPFLFRRNAKKELNMANPMSWLLSSSKSGVMPHYADFPLC